MDLSQLCRAAERRGSGRVPLDDPLLREGFEVLLRSIEDDVRPNFQGRLIIRQLLERALRTRVQFDQAVREQPRALEEAPRRPIVIAAMPRTGTTLLQRMLAADPAAMSLPLWLLMRPMPPPSADVWRRGGDARLLKAQVELSVLRAVAPALDIKHHVRPHQPDECTYLFMSAGLSLQFYALWPVVGYAAWAIEQDATPAYEMHRKMLQLYQVAQTGSHWVLKSPMHFLALRELVDVLPEARVIQLHRDPAVAVPSLHSLFTSTHQLVGGGRDRAAITKMTTAVLAERARRVVAERTRRNPDQFIDVLYDDLIADPVGVTRRIYERCDLDWTAEVERRVERVSRENPGREKGRHHYSLGDYGLSRGEIEDQFAEYIDYFGIPREG